MRRSRRFALVLCFGVPPLIGLLCYGWLAADRGTLDLSTVGIHESGRYTLPETILYFAHFLREVPTDLAYALFLLAGVAPLAGFGADGPVHRRRARRVGLSACLLAAGLVTVAFTAAAGRDGTASALQDLLQFRTRDDLLAYGSHWRFHWLSTLWWGVTAPLAASALARLFHGRARVRAGKPRNRAGWLAWGYFGVLSVAFGMSTDVFMDLRYVGHQAREILTHGTITLPLALGALLLTADRLGRRGGGAGAPVDVDTPDRSGGREPVTEKGGSTSSGSSPGIWSRGGASPIRWGLCLGIPVYLAVVALSGDVMAAGQPEQGLAAMVAGHAFEHTLDFVFVLLLAVGGYVVVLGRGRGRRDADPSRSDPPSMSHEPRDGHGRLRAGD